MTEEMTAREFLELIKNVCIERRSVGLFNGGTCKGCKALNICPQSKFAKDMDVDRVLMFANRIREEQK